MSVRDRRPNIRVAFVEPENRLRLFFYTSNEAKFAQAFFVFQRNGIVLSYFKSKVDPYSEDYGAGKSALLERAITEVTRSVGSSSLFFVEDTSLRIDGLSTTHDDFPGLRVKEWFASTTFEELDLQLRNRALGRNAVVSSDIALHLPGLTRPIFFSATTEGTVAESPPSFAESVQYPWLTPHSFNGWFIPRNATKPLGEMSVDESWQFDFRVRALEKLIDRIEEYSAILNVPAQSYTKRHAMRARNQLPLFASPTLVIVGPPCAGKTTFGEYASREFGLRFIEASSVMRMFRQRDEGADIVTMNDFDFARHVLTMNGADVVARRVVELFGSDMEIGFVISGFRTIEELDFIRSRFPDTKVVLVDARERTRFQRCLARGRSQHMTIQSFRNAGKEQESLGLLRVAEDFSDLRITNEGTIEQFQQQITSVVTGMSHNGVPGVTTHVRPRHQSIHNQLYRSLAVLEQAGRPLTCDEIEQMTEDMGIVVLANNANKVLKRTPGLARRLELDGTRIRYELLNGGRAYLRYLRSRMIQEGEIHQTV